MVNGESNTGERWKTTTGLISKKAIIHVRQIFSRNFLVSCFLKERSYVFLFTFFSLPRHWPIFTLHWWPLAFLLSLPPLQNFHVVIPTKKCLLFLSLALDLCRFFSRWASLACRLLCLFFGLFFSSSLFQICGLGN